MSFLTDVQELESGLIIFRRADVEHKNWYCRVKVPNPTTHNRYKTISLKTPYEHEARKKARFHGADIEFRDIHKIPIFEKTFGEVCAGYVADLRLKALAGKITMDRWKIVEGYFRLHIVPYAGHVPATQVDEDTVNGYPAWRKQNNAPAEDKESYGPRKIKANGEISEAPEKKAKPKPLTPAKDGTIRQEMNSFLGAINFGIRKKDMTESQRPVEVALPEDNARREAFTLQEYRKLHTDARSKWLGEGDTECQNWYRSMTYLYMLIMTNTGMRTIEARFLKWRNVETRLDKLGRTIVVFSVEGKKKFRQLVAAENVAKYLDQVKELSPATGPNDFVFCNFEGKQSNDNYDAYVESMLTTADLLMGEHGTRRSSYSFRHTYATFRLMEGVDSIFLALQMGTSTKMLLKCYGHITPVKNAERVLQGMTQWEPIVEIFGGTAVGVNAKAAEKKHKPARAKRRESFGRTKGEPRPTVLRSENQAHRPPRRT